MIIPDDEKDSEHGHVTPSAVARVHPIPGSTSINDPAGIRAVMAQTRAEMSGTIDALQERLDPQRLKEEATTKAREAAQRLKEQATEKVRAATIGHVEGKVGDLVNRVDDTADATRSGIADAIRHNPIPAALIGVGLAWIFFSGSDRNARGNRPSGRDAPDNRSPGRPRYGGMQAQAVRSASLGGGSVQETAQHVADQAGAGVQQVGQQVQQLGSQAQDQLENLTGQVKGTAQQIGTQAQEQVGQLRGAVQQFGSQAQDQVEELRGDVDDQVGSLRTSIQLQAERWSGSYNRMLRENPLALGVVALALGTTAAMLAPRTPREDQLFGEAREQVMQKAQVAAQEALDQVQKVAEQAQHAASATPRS